MKYWRAALWTFPQSARESAERVNTIKDDYFAGLRSGSPPSPEESGKATFYEQISLISVGSTNAPIKGAITLLVGIAILHAGVVGDLCASKGYDYIKTTILTRAT